MGIIQDASRDAGSTGSAGSGAGHSGSNISAGSESAAGSAAGGADSGAAFSAGVEPVELVAGSERERLLAEATAATAAAPAELSAQIEGGIGAQLKQITSWAQLTGEGVDIIAICFLPAWHLSDAERKRLSERLARLLDLIVPPNFGERTEAVVALVLCAGGIVASRALSNGGKLPPIGPQRPAASTAAQRDPMTITSLTDG